MKTDGLRWGSQPLEDYLLYVIRIRKGIQKTTLSEYFPVAELPKMRLKNMEGEKMEKEYDFSKAERGKFYHPEIKLNLPVYLDEEAFAFVNTIATNKNTDVSSIVNKLIHNDIKLAEVIK